MSVLPPVDKKYPPKRESTRTSSSFGRSNDKIHATNVNPKEEKYKYRATPTSRVGAVSPKDGSTYASHSRRSSDPSVSAPTERKYTPQRGQTDNRGGKSSPHSAPRTWDGSYNRNYNEPGFGIPTSKTEPGLSKQGGNIRRSSAGIKNKVGAANLSQSSEEKLDRSRGSANRSFERRLSNSISIPGLFDDEAAETRQNKSPRKTPTRKTTSTTPNKTQKQNDKKSKKTEQEIDEKQKIVSNLDTTGEQARLLYVKRLDTPEYVRKNSRTSGSEETSSTISEDTDAPDVFLPKRYILALMMFLGFMNMYAIRVNLNVAIGAMVNNHTFVQDGTAIIQAPEFNWSSRLQGIVLGSFYYGYMVLQIPGGYFAMKYGGTKIFGGAVFIASVLTVMTPIATRLSVWGLVALRILEGLVLGVMLPCNHQIWSLWAPIQERTTLVTLSIAGMNVGTVVTMPLTGLLTKYGFDGGWASVFYCFGVFGVLWSICWMFVAHKSPSSHPTISKKERMYIVKNVMTRKSMNIPWKAIFTSKAVYAVIIGNVANDWGLYTILICLPLFLMDIMKFNIQTMGFIASLPFLLKALVGPIGGVIADVARYKYTTTANVRRIFYAVGAMSAAVMIVIAGYSQSPTVVILTMCVGVALSGLLHSGYEVNVLDIAPCLSGIIMGISNTAGTTTGFLSPLLVGIMTEDKLRSQWILVFWITFVIYLIGTILFCYLLSGEAQHWAVDDEDDEDENVTEADESKSFP